MKKIPKSASIVHTAMTQPTATPILASVPRPDEVSFSETLFEELGSTFFDSVIVLGLDTFNISIVLVPTLLSSIPHMINIVMILMIRR